MSGSWDVDDLRTDGLHQRLALADGQPVFSWTALSESADEGVCVAVRSVGDDGTDVLWVSAPTIAGQRHLRYAGPRLESNARYDWQIVVPSPAGGFTVLSQAARFETGLIDDGEWRGEWISFWEPDSISEPEGLGAPRPAPILRRRFDLPIATRSARLHITALGVYEAYLNGHPVASQRRLAPGWTDYTRRLHYQSHDVTELLAIGTNWMAIELGDGWYSGTISVFGRRHYGDRPAARCELLVELVDGFRVRVSSGSEWEGRTGAMPRSDLIHGEHRDGRRLDGATAHTRDEGWARVVRIAGPGGSLQADPTVGVTAFERREARVIGLTEYTTLVDAGQNLAGVVSLRVRGPEGATVTIRHGEMLDAHGALYTDNLRTAQATDHYTLRGDAHGEHFEPRFTYHGFRYAEIQADAAGFEIDDVAVVAITSATGDHAEFDCSDPLVSRLHENIRWGMRSNFVSIPTDCPQRDERMGWSGDVQLFAPTALTLADVTNELAKWVDDLIDAQHRNGAFPTVAPRIGETGFGMVGWADAGVIVPWTIYSYTGRVDLIDRWWPAVRRYVDYLEADTTDGRRDAGRYGDWVCLGRPTSKRLLGTAYLAHVLDRYRELALLTADADEVVRAAQLRDVSVAAFRDEFVDGGGRLNDPTQTACALALNFDLIVPSSRPLIADQLANLIRDAGDQLTTGFLGTPEVLPALSVNGHHDLACRLIRRGEVPGWLHAVRHGATTVWERWDSWTPEGGFHPSGMNSFNHFAIGSVGAWMHRYLAGLRHTSPGFRSCDYDARPTEQFDRASARHRSPLGLHHIAWHVDHARLEIEATVPVGCAATLLLPGHVGGTLTGPVASAVLDAGDRHVRLSVGTSRASVDLDEASETGC